MVYKAPPKLLLQLRGPVLIPDVNKQLVCAGHGIRSLLSSNRLDLITVAVSEAFARADGATMTLVLR